MFRGSVVGSGGLYCFDAASLPAQGSMKVRRDYDVEINENGI